MTINPTLKLCDSLLALRTSFASTLEKQDKMYNSLFGNIHSHSEWYQLYI